MQAFQAERTDLLINTEWGIPKDQISKEEAKSKDLVSFKGRWVSSDEQKVLKAQNYTYKSIIAVRALFFLCATWYLLMAFLAGHFSLTGAVWPGVVGPLALISALGLMRFRQWAFYTGVVTIALAIVKTGVYMVESKFEPWLAVAIVVFLLMLNYLCRKPARDVFFPPALERSNQEDLAGV